MTYGNQDKRARAAAIINSPGKSGLWRFSRTCLCLLILLCSCLVFGSAVSTVIAEDQPAASPADNQPEGKVDPLYNKQLSLASRFKRFEDTMRKIADYTKKTDPDRAELLYRAIGKSQGAQIPQQMQLVVNLLEKNSFGDAQLRQEDLVNELYLILQILQSEDEQDRLKKEIARIEDLIKDVNKTIGKQKDVRAETERGGKFNDVEKKQSDVAKDADKIIKKIDAQDNAKKQEKDARNNPSKGDQNKSPDNKSGDNKNNGENKDQKSDEPKNQDNKPADMNNKDGQENKGNENKEDKNKDKNSDMNKDDPKKDDPDKSESKDNKPNSDNKQPPKGEDSKGKPSKGEQSKGEQSKGEQSKGQPQEGQQQDGQKQDDQKQDGQQSENQQQNQEEKPQDKAKTPGREEIEQAKEKMEKAIEELKKQARTNASNEQDKAIAELEKAKAKLEELLRQLREEERELKLAALEARFRRMLEMQIRVRQSTFTLSQTPEAELASRHSQRAQQLSRDEDEITLEADKALLIMREDGGSIAFPEAVEQMKEDMTTVSTRLLEIKLDKLTVSIEDDIIEALKEMVEALQKEQEQIKQNKQQRQQGQQPQDPELTNKLAELKMLRSLQNRINRRTRQYGEQIDGEQALNPDLITLLKELSIRQSRVQAATYAMAKGKNK